MFAYLYRTVFGDLLQPDDDFFTRCRKTVISCFFVFGVINVFADTFTAVTRKQWSVLNTVSMASSYVAIATWISGWAYAKITRTSPEWLINLVMDVALCRVVFVSFSSPDLGWHALCLSLAIAAVVIGTSHMKGQVAVCSFVFIVNAYDTLGLPSILLPGSFEGNVLIRQILNGVAASLALSLVYITMAHFCFLIGKSAANVQMAKEVSKKLVLYDTEGALALLSAQEQSEIAVDSGLVAVLREIAHNLDQYRPHLPSYLLHQSTNNGDGRRNSVFPRGLQEVKPTSVLGKIYHSLYTALLQSDDDFFMRARKGSISTAFMIAVFASIATLGSIRSAASLDTLATFMHPFGSLVIYSIQISAWVYMKITRSA